MAELIEDRVKEITTTTGLDDFVLGGNVLGYRPFSAVGSAGDTFHGCVEAVDSSGAPTGEWEIGFYTLRSGGVVERTLVVASSATSNAKVSFGPGMKYIFIDLVARQVKQFAVASATGQAATPYGQNASEYTAMTFQEEFSGTTYDTTKWNPTIYYKANNATQNFSVANGNMNIYPQVDSTGAFFDRTFATDGKFSQLYGFFEMEAKLPVGAGLNPRFNLFNNDEHEFSIFQAFTGAPTGGWSTADLRPIDFQLQRATDFRGGPIDTLRASSFITVPDLSAAFHKYALRWDSTTIRWFLDGVQVGPTMSHSSMRVPMYIYFGVWRAFEETSPTVGSGTLSSANRYTPQGITNSFMVNYVRAWQIA